jgi:CheY-like chemotaxis protein
MSRILVIDDEQEIRTLLERLLSQKGYEVLLAANGREGLEFFHQEHPDAVVLDLKMPEMDGFEVLRQIRLVNQRVPVIVLTGAGILEMEQLTYALGVTEYLEKEFSLHHLGDSLKRHLAISSTST